MSSTWIQIVTEYLNSEKKRKMELERNEVCEE